MEIKELFYVANIIDYVRVVALVYAWQSTGYVFAAWYAFSYGLDCFDGMAARMLGQESRLGYYLDMVIDRISSCLCLHAAAQVVLSGVSFVPPVLNYPVVVLLYGCLVFVEVISHGVVCYMAEVLQIHQKKLGFDLKIVRLYLNSKTGLFFGCASFELFALSLIVNSSVCAVISFPGFAFRAAANICRLLSIMRGSSEKKDDDADAMRRRTSSNLVR